MTKGQGHSERKRKNCFFLHISSSKLDRFMSY